ncbi:o-sialoglycoprotein endopeptidase [Holotrichia oblita]|uniref:O-sialoglycoprotein endopeptidase n=1 Tax=Holotrichia oblita TaxID=644536 RepID=A0ACB9TUC6_HOLOL|nr:o-sialoglycoprotein endopeptidase [Holotrichia oblita]
MEGFKLIKQGAESKLFQGSYLGVPTLVKDRFKKKYRHPTLDDTLMKERIKAEVRAILKCKTVGIRTPTLYLVDLNRRSIFMEYFPYSVTAKEFIFNANESLIEVLSHCIGKLLGKMHANNIIHGDLTTSNILISNKQKIDIFYESFQNLELILIDFGLSHTDSTIEDKAVDLYVLERAILSTHTTTYNIFTGILNAYKIENKNYKEVFNKLEEVQARGRKRTMVG